MKSTLVSVTMLLSILMCASSAIAEDRVIQLWKCELQEGKTLEDAKQINGKWLKLQNSGKPSAGIRSWGLTSIVGETGGFGYLDSYPSLEAWTRGQATMKTDAGKKLDAELNATANCSMNWLYEAAEH